MKKRYVLDLDSLRWPVRSSSAAKCAAFAGLLAVSTALLAQTSNNAMVSRGQYLMNATGCMDCHTPHKPTANGVEPDLSRMLSGHPETLKMPPAPKLPDGPWVWIGAGTNTAFAGPWGVSYASNLTPADKETGIGNWTEQQFIDTIRTGKHFGVGRAILPPMPWPAFKNFSDDDLRSLFAYLRSLPPIKNRVPPSEPSAHLAK